MASNAGSNGPKGKPQPQSGTPHPTVPKCLWQVPRGLFIMTAAWEGVRAGLRVDLVQVAATDPPSVSVALPKGMPISPLVRDARAFGLCIASDADAAVARRFEHDRTPSHTDSEHPTSMPDPFDGFDTAELETGAPLLKRAVCCLDCRVTMHIDFEADHELFIAEVVAGLPVNDDAGPAIRTGDPYAKR